MYTHTCIVSVLTPIDFRYCWAIFGPLVDENTQKGSLAGLPASEKFSRLFCACFKISIWNLVYTSSVGSATHAVRVPSQSGQSGLLYSKKNGSKPFFFIYDFKSYIDPSDMSGVFTRTYFRHGWAIFGPLVATNTRKGDLSRAPHKRKVVFFFF